METDFDADEQEDFTNPPRSVAPMMMKISTPPIPVQSQSEEPTVTMLGIKLSDPQLKLPLSTMCHLTDL